MYRSTRLRDALLRVLEPPAPKAPKGAGAVPAAVLVPILGAGSEPRAVFTRRTDTLSRHAGEISFPGGLVDPGEPPMAAALREAEEELGLRPSDVEVLGALPKVHTHVTGMLIQPFVGWITIDPRFTPNDAEIAEVLEFPVADLIARGGESEFQWEGQRFLTYVYDMGGTVIWGATARVLYTMLELLQGRAPAEWEVRRVQ